MRLEQKKAKLLKVSCVDPKFSAETSKWRFGAKITMSFALTTDDLANLGLEDIPEAIERLMRASVKANAQKQKRNRTKLVLDLAFASSATTLVGARPGGGTATCAFTGTMSGPPAIATAKGVAVFVFTLLGIIEQDEWIDLNGWVGAPIELWLDMPVLKQKEIPLDAPAKALNRDGSKKAADDSIKSLSTTNAIRLVGKCTDPTKLHAWLLAEPDGKIIQAINARLDEIEPKPAETVN